MLGSFTRSMPASRNLDYEEFGGTLQPLNIELLMWSALEICKF
jgi:hypothetical protein